MELFYPTTCTLFFESLRGFDIDRVEKLEDRQNDG
jgi:hypothetical protein